MTALATSSPVLKTLHKRIRSDIGRRILSGEWPPGYRIPVEHDLMSQYSCSRMTVSKALNELALEHLIERRKRAGTFVRRPQMLSAVLHISDIRAEISALGRAYRYELIAGTRRRATAIDRARLGISKPLRVRAVECRHSADGVPFAHETRLINLGAVPEAEHANFVVEPPGTWLLAHVPWTEAEHTISAIAADDRLSDALEIDPGAPCLVIERRTWRVEKRRGPCTLTAVRLVYPGAAHQLVARFEGR